MDEVHLRTGAGSSRMGSPTNSNIHPVVGAACEIGIMPVVSVLLVQALTHVAR